MEDIELLRPLVLQGLLNTDYVSEKFDFKKWVSKGEFLVEDITGKSLELKVSNEYSLSRMMAFDSCRMASASFETMQNIQTIPMLAKSNGWIAIKSYYAAFFSAHSIIRCFGLICSQLEKGHISKINQYALSLGISTSAGLTSGFYIGEYESTNRKLLLKKLNNTHEDTWLAFKNCLKKISLDVLSVSGLSSQKQNISSNLDDLIYRLTQNGKFSNGNFLSSYRNEVNYRHEYNVWHPYGSDSIKSEKITNVMSQWNKQGSYSAPEWKESKKAFNFFITCLDVVKLNYFLIEMISENSLNTPNIYSMWPQKLLKLIKK